MNVAGRKIVVSMATSGSPGFRAAIAASTSRVTWSVLPSGCFSTISIRPSPRLITASPIGGGKPSTTSATSPMRSAFPGLPAVAALPAVPGRTMICRRSSGVETAGKCAMASRCCGVSR